MDDSWRMRLGLPTGLPQPRHFPNYPPRRSTEDATSHRRKPISPDLPDDPLNPEDFSDVFGGPPRTILSRQFSTAFPRSSSSTGFFYEEIFRPSEKAPPPIVGRSGRSLPEFRIPGQQTTSDHNHHKREINSFYGDIFAWEDDSVVRSRSRSKTSSSSVLSSEELSPLRPAISGDSNDDVSLFASKLRPLNVRARWSSRRIGHDDYQRQQNMMPPFAGTRPIYNAENDFSLGLSRRNASPETISLEPMSNGSFRVSADDLKLNSPSSAVSSVCQSDREQTTREIEEEILRQDAMEQDEDESMSSYVIEINSDIREGTCESNAVDEAIAWAKEKFQTHCHQNKFGMQECGKDKPTEVSETLDGHQPSEGNTNSFGSLDEQQDKWAAREQTQQFGSMILWSDSGWSPVPLANIIEIPKVKKAYQRARLCLHPDKLQQRGATHQQKYIAEKAFSVLQVSLAFRNLLLISICVNDLKSCSQFQSVAVKEEKNQRSRVHIVNLLLS
ncbi:J domain-containing protein required for chloroplast accumulation response 1 [Sesamum angolense]|uniref:J domain-containing protein required for chloroplast accumulation response 1 n=1 Tax=Sesamum angolense TaxID=2727404 RepID=A0AAE1WTI6_9LAMI|nr:J domain-containing protein required for chloroplast accumulation response 1 [Sesamum angolense]